MFNLIILLSKEFNKKNILNKTNVCLDKRNLKLITQNWLEIFNNYLFNVSEDLPGITELFETFLIKFHHEREYMLQLVFSALTL